MSESDWKDIIYWRVCPACQKEKFREAILKWADYRAQKLVIVVKCPGCETK